jgi:hypothetical protein
LSDWLFITSPSRLAIFQLEIPNHLSIALWRWIEDQKESRGGYTIELLYWTTIERSKNSRKIPTEVLLIPGEQ